MRKEINAITFLSIFVAGTVVGVGGMLISGSADHKSRAPLDRAPIDNGAARGTHAGEADTDTSLPEAITFPGNSKDLDNLAVADSNISPSGSLESFPADTIGAIQSAVKIQSTSGKLEYLSLLQHLTPEDAPRLLGAFRKLSQQGYKVGDYDRLFWERWAEIDGEAASRTMFERDKRFNETNLSKLAISTWARNDPNAASSWLSQQEDIPLRDGMTKGLLEGMATSDPDLAENYLSSANLLPEQIAYGYSQVARQKGVQEGLDSVGAWYSSFSEDDPNFTSVTNATAGIYAQASFADALSWANTLEGSPEAASNTRQQLYARLAHNRPDGLISHLGSDTNAELLNGVAGLAERAVVRWIKRTPYAMGKWLQKNEDIRNYDLVVTPFVEQIALENLEAAQKWAGTIRAPITREEVTMRIAGNQ